MSRNARRIALSFGTAAGAAVIAASFSMGTAPKAGADASDADAVSSLVGALDPSALSAASVADTALPAATETVNPADAISYLIDALDPDQFTSTGAPAGVFGLVGWSLDYYLFGPTAPLYEVDAFLEPYVEEIIKSLPAGAESVDVSPVSDLVGALDPSAFSAGVADLTAPTAVSLLDPVIDGLLNSF